MRRLLWYCEVSRLRGLFSGLLPISPLKGWNREASITPQHPTIGGNKRLGGISYGDNKHKNGDGLLGARHLSFKEQFMYGGPGIPLTFNGIAAPI